MIVEIMSIGFPWPELKAVKERAEMEDLVKLDGRFLEIGITRGFVSRSERLMRRAKALRGSQDYEPLVEAKRTNSDHDLSRVEIATRLVFSETIVVVIHLNKKKKRD